jgi:S1-C subfamily serine protease
LIIMRRHLWGYGVVLVVAILSPLGAENPSRLQDAQALETTMEEAIAKAEPSIACILVSRSKKYDEKLGSDAERKRAEENRNSGKLGGYVPAPPAAENGWPRGPGPGVRVRDLLDLSEPNNVPESYGSGVVIDAKEELILTNFHVVRDAVKIYVRLPSGKGSYADIHAADSRSDFAVLRLIDKVPDLKPLKKGDASNLKKGQFVLSLANPYAAGFRDGSPSASWGIISNIRRRPPGSPNEQDRTKNLHQYGTLLQLDARMNLGCSGGAVIDLKGELVGLTSAEAALSGVETPGGFAVPMDAGMWRIVEKLKEGKEVEYGFLGVSFEKVDFKPGEQHEGVVIERVITGSPADQAWDKEGLRRIQPRDMIMSIDGVRVHEIEELFLVISVQLAGREVQIEVKPEKGGGWEKRTVKLAKFNSPGKTIASNVPAAMAGLRVDYASLLAQRQAFDPRFGQISIPSGVIIREVIPGSSADSEKLQPDKVITQVNNQRVTTPTEFYVCMENARKNGDTVDVFIAKSDGSSSPVTLTFR